MKKERLESTFPSGLYNEEGPPCWRAFGFFYFFVPFFTVSFRQMQAPDADCNYVCVLPGGVSSIEFTLLF